jgi:hypothetical protein
VGSEMCIRDSRGCDRVHQGTSMGLRSCCLVPIESLTQPIVVLPPAQLNPAVKRDSLLFLEFEFELVSATHNRVFDE